MRHLAAAVLASTTVLGFGTTAVSADDDGDNTKERLLDVSTY